MLRGWRLRAALTGSQLVVPPRAGLCGAALEMPCPFTLSVRLLPNPARLSLRLLCRSLSLLQKKRKEQTDPNRPH